MTTNSPDLWADGADVVRRLCAAGHQAWLVGGCVRDRLLGRQLHDADVATSAEPDEVERVFPRTVAVGKAFGVIRVLPDSEEPGERFGEIEVASLRADDRYVDGRRPQSVRRGTLQEDAERRDLTINALYADPSGQITDLVGGLRDLAARVLRGIGDPAARLAEDRLRVVRVLRFAAMLGFTIEPATADAVRSTTISGVARERVLDEFAKAATSGVAGAFLRACREHGHLQAIAPCADAEVAAQLLDRLGPAPADLALAAWLLPGGEPAAAAWLETQPGPGAWRRVVPWLIATGPVLGSLPLSQRRRALRRTEGSRLAALAAALDPARAAEFAVWAARDANPEPCPVTAKDLLDAGWQAGPGLGAALRLIEDAWLEGAAATTADLLALAKRTP